MIFIVAGPSGVSKTYLCREILSDFGNFYIPRKATTRKRRPGEGDDEYIFVTVDEYRELEAESKFELSTAIYGNRYGLLKDELSNAFSESKDAIFVLDVFIAQKFKRRNRKSVLIYVMPCEPGALTSYIRSRAETYKEPSEERVRLLAEELEQWRAFDYVIPFVNSEVAYQLLRNIIISEHCRPDSFNPDMNPEQFLQFRNFPRLAVDLVMIDRCSEQVALVERWKEPYGWALPGGFVQYGETVEDAVVREAMEETGLRPERISMIGVFSQPQRDPRMHVVSIAFLAYLAEGGRPGGDARGLQWFPVKDLPDGIVFDHREIINSALRGPFA